MIDYSKIEKTLIEMGEDSESHKISYSMVPITSSSLYEENGTKLVDLKAHVDVTFKKTGEKISFPVDLLRIPHYGKSGFTIKGRSKQVIADYTLADGFYVMSKSNNVGVSHVKINVERGRPVLIYAEPYELFLSLGNRRKNPVPLSIFLKAVTGNSFEELYQRLGDNIYTQVSFNKEEPLRSECIDIVVKALFPEYKEGIRSIKYESLSLEDRFSIIYNSLLNGNFTYLGDISGIRLKRLLTFKERCKGLFLSKSIEKFGVKFQANTNLDSKILDTLDYLPINEIEVMDSENIYQVKKDSIYNFRALGHVLEEDIQVGNTLIPKGKTLTFQDLKLLDTSNLTKIRVSYKGTISDCRRTIFDGSLKVSDIISVVQVYLNTIQGLEVYDNLYDLSNQSLRTLDSKIRSLITANCKAINMELLGHLDLSAEKDLLSKVITMTKPNLNDLIDYISDHNTRESQQAEINNIMQKISKEHRASKDVQRSNPSMVEIQESQFGRLDVIKSPESSKIGIVQSRTYYSEIDEYGFVRMPVVRVEDGKVLDGDPIYLSVGEQADQFIAEWDETFYHEVDGKLVKKEKVKALSLQTFIEVPVEDVKYKQWGPYDTMSPSRMQIPFPEHSAQKRILMGSNHQEQASVPINNERPYVSSGGDSLMDDGLITAESLLGDYYDRHRVELKTPEEEFLNYTLKLDSVEIKKNYKVLNLSIIEIPGAIIKTEIPFMQKANSGSMFSYTINSMLTEYRGHDVIAHSNNYDIKKYNIYKNVNFGSMKISDSKFDNAIALSRNFTVAFKTHESSTIDDAVLLNADVVGLHHMSVIDISSVTYELQNDKVNRETGISEIENFGFKETYPKHMNSNGLPILGTVLKPGDVVLGVKTQKLESNRSIGTKEISVKEKRITLDSTIEGQVIQAIVEDGKATVLLATLKPIEVGDKIAGRHGNKGTIAKIVPREYMPFDPETGLIPDLVINPLGVPSRSNISQLLEATLGFAMKKIGKVCVVSPFKGKTFDFVKEMANETNTKPIFMRDGRTGQWFKRPINVGVMYILNLEHKVSHKIKSVGASSKLDPVFNQPSKGGGGQAIGEMETWSLMAIGANKVIQDLFSVQSDDLDSIKVLSDSIEENISSIEIEGSNNNDHLFQVLFRGLCVEPVYENGSLTFKPMNDKMIKGLSNRPVDINNKESLQSADIFGITSNNKSKFQNRTTWSWMPLHCEMVHPFFIVKGGLNKLIFLEREVKKKDSIEIQQGIATEDMIRNLISCKAFLEKNENGRFRYREGQGELTGMEALIKLVRAVDLKRLENYHNGLLERAKANGNKANILSSSKSLRMVTGLIESGVSVEDFIITALPVIPLSFRPKPKFEHILQDFDFYYHRIIDEIVKYKSSTIKTQESIFNIFMRIVEFSGLTYPGSKPEKNYKPLLKYFTGRENAESKHGRVRENMLKKRVLFSGRTVIIPSSDMTRPANKIGIPYMMVTKVWGSHLAKLLEYNFEHLGINLNEWKSILEVVATNRVMFNKLSANHKVTDHYTLDEFYDKIYGVIKNYLEGYVDENGNVITKPKVVIAGRQPSLHQFSIRAYNPVIVAGKCIEISPLVTKGYNADFDGDQMWFTALMNTSAEEEAIKLMSPKDNIVNPKDGSIILEHSQDIRLGIYYSTMLHDNIESIEGDDRYNLSKVKYYSNKERLEVDIDIGIISLHDLVCFNYRGNSYLSTAGRILVNSLFPKGYGFTDNEYSNVLGIKGINTECYKDLRFDGLISGNGGIRKELKYIPLNKITRWSYETYTSDDNLEVFQKLSELGFKYSDMSGISIYLSDLESPIDMSRYIEQANKFAEIINRRYYQGVISDEERKKDLIYLYSECKDRIKKRFMSSFERNNNIFIMVDSGARGNEDQIMQASGIIGILQKSKDEVLETPILSNYTQGTSCFETLQLSYSTRTGVASTQNETSDSGELTRLAVYMMNGFPIVEKDCGSGLERFKLKAGDHTGKVTSPDGKEMLVDELLGKEVIGDAYILKLLKNFLENGKITTKCLEILLDNKVREIELSDGIYNIYYKLDSLMESMLLYRKSKDLPYLKDGYITTETIEYLERENVGDIDLRTMLSCKSVGGVCSECYGLKYDKLVLPEVGELVGVVAAQSIGEPASQLTMSLFHKLGEANASIDKGVQLYSETLNKGFTDKLMPALIAPVEGYVVDVNTNPYIITDSGEKWEIPKVELSVSEGEYVRKNDPLTQGFLMPDKLVDNITKEELRFIQMALLEIHFRIFELNKIEVYARHFEVIVRAQTSLVRVINSDDEDIKVGELVDITSLEGKEVETIFTVARSREVVRHYGGLDTLLAHGRLADSLGSMVISGSKSDRMSSISKLFQGQDISSDEPRKIFIAPKFMYTVKGESMSKDDNTKVAEILLNTVIEETTAENIEIEDINWDNFFESEESTEPEISDENKYNPMKDREEEKVIELDVFN